MSNKGHVLYCEDHDDTRVIVSLMLEQAGFEVTSTGCAKDCLELAQSGKHFDLYLLDHTFPDASGVTLCRELRKANAEMPILFYSARAMEAEKKEALEAGAQDYLIKPRDIFNLTDHVARWIGV